MSQYDRTRNNNKNRPLVNRGLVIFTEGETEIVFYKRLVEFIKATNKDRKVVEHVLYKNMGGVSRFGSKPARVLRYKVQPEHKGLSFSVALAYDTDAFDQYRRKPPVDWKQAKRDLREAGVKSIVEVPAKSSIEDWFLLDFDGVKKHLGLESDTKMPPGDNGQEKIKKLFKKANRIYVKGEQCSGLVDCLDMSRICSTLVNEIAPLYKVLFYN